MRVQLNLVLIAAHNSEDTLRICISSALFGLGKHDEVLVLLDACKDNSEAVAFGFRDKRVRVFRSDEQLGRDGARNFLLQHAKGKFISILDSDDISFP